MSTPVTEKDAALAAEVWRRLLDFMMGQREQHLRVLSDLGLTPGDMKALLELEPGRPQPMRVLAEAWRCDASNVTWMVDRLEQRGLVERRMTPSDRRVKAVALTRAGEEIKAEMLERLYTPPDALFSLPRADLDALLQALSQLPGPQGGGARST